MTFDVRRGGRADAYRWRLENGCVSVEVRSDVGEGRFVVGVNPKAPIWTPEWHRYGPARGPPGNPPNGLPLAPVSLGR